MSALTPRERLDLRAGWRFMPDPYPAADRSAYAAPALADRTWRPAPVPASFDQIAPELAGYQGAAWLRCTVTVPAAWEGRRVSLDFAGVNDHADVWLNGVPVARNSCGFLPFSADVQDHICYGGPNVIAVRADNARAPEDLFRDIVGWQARGGIVREVSLLATSLTHIHDVHVTAEPTDGGGQVSLAITIRNASSADFSGRVCVVLEDGAGAAIADLAGVASVARGSEQTVSLAAAARGVSPWSPAHPALYTARVTLKPDAGAAVDGESVRFGFRSIRVAGTELVLNGQPLKLRGFNRHEDTSAAGMCPDPAAVRRDLAAMKECGANFVRLAHYPHHPLELDLCDELGLLALEEIPLYWWLGDAEGEGIAPRKLAGAAAQLERMIRRDRNHPAIVFWSVSNETDESRPEVRAGNAELLRRARSLDPTRLAVHVSDHGWVDADAFSEDDVICVNAYPSMKPVLVESGSPDDLSRSTQEWRTFLAMLHARYPAKPILVAEFGFVALSGVLDGPMGENTQARVIEAEHAGMAADYVCGMAVWCWADHAWPHNKAFLRFMSTSPYGVMTRDRRPKRAVETLRRLFER